MSILTIRLNTPYKQNLVNKLKDQLKLASASKALIESAEICINQLPSIKRDMKEAERFNRELEGILVDVSKYMKKKMSLENMEKNLIKKLDGSTNYLLSK